MAEETRTFLWTNNAVVRLAEDIDDSQTEIEVVNGARLPSPSGGDEIATLILKDAEADKYEIMYITGRGGNTLTVERGAEGTTATEWLTGTKLKHGLTAALFRRIANPVLTYFTSGLYPTVITDGLQTALSVPYDPNFLLLTEGMDSLFSIQSGDLREPLVTYDDALPEAVDSLFSIQSGDIRNPLITYDDALPEAIESSFSAQSGDIRVALVTYSNYPAEAVETTLSIESGTLV